MIRYTTLIDTQTLSGLLSDDLVLVDCRFDLANTAAGEAAYEQVHIPGAVYAHLDRDLSGPKTGTNGRHPLPSPEALIATFSRFGIDSARQVVAYDQDSGMYASRLWWLLRWMGHDATAVLDGGFTKWCAEGHSTAAGRESRRARSFTGTPHDDMVVTATQLPDLVAAPGTRLIDARAPERYRGDVEPIDPVAGHIPGAMNLCFLRNLAGGKFLDTDALRTMWLDSLGDTEPEKVVCYCGSGVTACHDLLAMEHAGLPGAKLYAGSWSEWVADPDRPIARGDE